MQTPNQSQIKYIDYDPTYKLDFFKAMESAVDRNQTMVIKLTPEQYGKLSEGGFEDLKASVHPKVENRMYLVWDYPIPKDDGTGYNQVPAVVIQRTSR
jgi:hypothetical protein